jgi:peptide/nickel transport system permease protein
MNVLKKLVKNPTSLFGIILLILFALIAIFAPVLAPVPEKSRDAYMIPRDGFQTEPALPSAEHWFGTTEGQYDIYYGIIWGTRTAFRIGIVITLITTLIGIIIGCTAGFYGGWVDDVLMRITEFFQTFPFLLAAITMTSILQTMYGRSDKSPLLIIAKILAFLTFGRNPMLDLEPVQIQILTGMIAIIAFGWMTIARVVRGNIMSEKENDYVTAARVIGSRNLRIMARHLLPNAVFPVLVMASMDIGSYVMTFAALSFLGLGAQRGYADWGQMISFARNWIPSLATNWHIVLYPGMAIILYVLAWNLVGDILRDILDPRMRGSGHGL